MKSSMNGAIFSSVLLVDGCAKGSASLAVFTVLLDLENKQMIEFWSQVLTSHRFCRSSVELEAELEVHALSF
jgi:hypothetical protein